MKEAVARLLAGGKLHGQIKAVDRGMSDYLIPVSTEPPVTFFPHSEQLRELPDFRYETLRYELVRVHLFGRILPVFVNSAKRSQQDELILDVLLHPVVKGMLE